MSKLHERNAYLRGYASAYEFGDDEPTLEANPYRKGTDEYDDFERGTQDAEQDN